MHSWQSMDHFYQLPHKWEWLSPSHSSSSHSANSILLGRRSRQLIWPQCFQKKCPLIHWSRDLSLKTAFRYLLETRECLRPRYCSKIDPRVELLTRECCRMAVWSLASRVGPLHCWIAQWWPTSWNLYCKCRILHIWEHYHSFVTKAVAMNQSRHF